MGMQFCVLVSIHLFKFFDATLFIEGCKLTNTFILNPY